MVATLSFLIIELAETLTLSSLLARPVMPGKGNISRLQTSESKFSIRTRSVRDGVNTCTRFVVRSDCDRFIVLGEEECGTSFKELVCFMMTWQRVVFGPIVVAL